MAASSRRRRHSDKVARFTGKGRQFTLAIPRFPHAGYSGLEPGSASPHPLALAAGVPGDPLPCAARAPRTFRGQGGEDGVLGGRPPHVLQNLLHRGGRRAGGQHHALPGLGAHPWRRKRGALTGAPFSTSGPFLPHSEPRPTLGLARQRPASPVPQFPRGGTQGRREIAWAHAPGRGDRGAAASASGRSAAPPPGREAHFLSPPTTLKGVAPRAGCAVRAGPGAGWEELQPQPPSTQGVGVGSRPGFPRCVTKHPKPSFLQVGDTAHNPRRCRGNKVPVHARWPGAQCALSERQLLARWPGTQDACQHLSCRIWVRVASLTSKTPSLLMSGAWLLLRSWAGWEDRLEPKTIFMFFKQLY